MLEMRRILKIIQCLASCRFVLSETLKRYFKQYAVNKRLYPVRRLNKLLGGLA